MLDPLAYHSTVTASATFLLSQSVSWLIVSLEPSKAASERVELMMMMVKSSAISGWMVGWTDDRGKSPAAQQ